MKPEERFIHELHLLDPIVLSLNASAIKNFSEASFASVQRQAQSPIDEYRKGLVSQVFADVKATLAREIELIISGQQKQAILKQGKTVKNGNVRFFCKSPELTPGKYATLFQHIETGARYFFIVDFDGQRAFQLPFKTNPHAKSLISIEGAYRATFLLGLTPFMRSYVACCQPETELLQAIAQGDIRRYVVEGNSALLNPAVCGQLNDSQQLAIAGFVQLPRGIQLLMGPPGTGKTTTIVSAVKSLLAGHGPRRPIVICGPSNKSVQVIAPSLIKKFPEIKVALYTHESHLDPATKDVLIPLLVEQQKELLLGADVVCMTLSAAGSSFIVKTLKGKVDVAIVDEVGQSVESETLIVFGLGVQKVLLVGDIKQLPPTVLADEAERFHYDWSMLFRLQKECGQPYGLLDTQYRMHTAISEFPRNAFYDGAVKDGVTAEDRAGKNLDPYLVIDVEGQDERDVVTRSYKNLREAQHVVKLVQHVMRAGYRSNDIAIITPYKAQTALIKQLLLQHDIPPDDLKINTVDSFQGEESPVVFVSMVRANAKMRIGFLGKFQRLNVAITRPQEVLRVVMSGDTLNPLTPKGAFEGDFVYLCRQLLKVVMPHDEDPRDTLGVMSRNEGHGYSQSGFRQSLGDYYVPVETWDDDYDFSGYLYNEDGELVTCFEGPTQISDLISMLEHYKGDYSNTIGKLPILMLPDLPKGTHVMQDILNRIKMWRKLPFKGLPGDTFKPYSYLNFYKQVEAFEDYGYPFDEYDDYCPAGYSVGHTDTEEHDVESKDLVFDSHCFLECDLREVDFHNSHFKNTLFTGSDVRDCQVNLENMDECSRLSFIKARQESALCQGLPKLLPTDELVLNAIQRGVYRPTKKDWTTFFGATYRAEHGRIEDAAQASGLGVGGGQVAQRRW